VKPKCQVKPWETEKTDRQTERMKESCQLSYSNMAEWETLITQGPSKRLELNKVFQREMIQVSVKITEWDRRNVPWDDLMKQRNTRALKTAPLLIKSMAAPRGTWRRHRAQPVGLYLPLPLVPLPFHPDSSDSLYLPSSWFPCDFVSRTTMSLHSNGFCRQQNWGIGGVPLSTHSRELTHTILMPFNAQAALF